MTTTIKARPTVYKGIQMRSRLEAGFAAWLDKFKAEWTYEPRAYAGENGQYLPDFEVTDIPVMGQPMTVFVEVKPKHPDIATVEAQSAILYGSDPASLMVVVYPDDFRFQAIAINRNNSRDIIWTMRPDGTLGLDIAIPPCDGPWHGEWWKPSNAPATPPVAAQAKPDLLAILQEHWERLVGPDLAAHSTPKSLTDQVLVLATDSTAWRTQVRLLNSEILERVKQLLGPTAVRVIEQQVPARSARSRRRK